MNQGPRPDCFMENVENFVTMSLQCAILITFTTLLYFTFIFQPLSEKPDAVHFIGSATCCVQIIFVQLISIQCLQPLFLIHIVVISL
jgi:hypothetical protein